MWSISSCIGLLTVHILCVCSGYYSRIAVRWAATRRVHDTCPVCRRCLSGHVNATFYGCPTFLSADWMSGLNRLSRWSAKCYGTNPLNSLQIALDTLRPSPTMVELTQSRFLSLSRFFFARQAKKNLDNLLLCFGSCARRAQEPKHRYR